MVRVGSSGGAGRGGLEKAAGDNGTMRGRGEGWNKGHNLTERQPEGRGGRTGSGRGAGALGGWWGFTPTRRGGPNGTRRRRAMKAPNKLISLDVPSSLGRFRERSRELSRPPCDIPCGIRSGAKRGQDRKGGARAAGSGIEEVSPSTDVPPPKSYRPQQQRSYPEGGLIKATARQLRQQSRHSRWMRVGGQGGSQGIRKDHETEERHDVDKQRKGNIDTLVATATPCSFQELHRRALIRISISSFLLTSLVPQQIYMNIIDEFHARETRPLPEKGGSRRRQRPRQDGALRRRGARGPPPGAPAAGAAAGSAAASAAAAAALAGTGAGGGSGGGGIGGRWRSGEGGQRRPGRLKGCGPVRGCAAGGGGACGCVVGDAVSAGPGGGWDGGGGMLTTWPLPSVADRGGR